MDNDQAYENAAHIAGGAAYPARWAAAAESWRRRARAQLDLPYGPHPRQRFDLYLPRSAPRGLAVFVHGGYWRQFGKDDWSHLAAGPVAAGWAVAIPSYRLAPEVRIREITGDARAALVAAAARVAGPLVLTGHSAGGHLAARILCGDAGLPDDLAARLARCVPISALSDLRPLLKTAMSADLRLDPAEAEAESPVLCDNVLPVPVIAWVGGDERPAFLDQSRWLADAWPNARLRVEPGRHHFNVIEGLQHAGSPLCTALLGGI